MAVREVLTLGEPVLRQRAKRVPAIDDSIRRLVDDMIETMHAYQGVGLAAPQIGVSLRVAVIQLPEPDEPVHVLINPQFVKQEGERLLYEGCLSIPGYKAEVPRSEQVVVKAVDLQGREFRLKAKGDLLAQALEHELDHLNGVLYIDYLESLDKLERVGVGGEAEAEAEEESPV